jgi:hypothetical protein
MILPPPDVVVDIEHVPLQLSPDLPHSSVPSVCTVEQLPVLEQEQE